MVWPKGELSRLSVGNAACNVHLRSVRIMNSFREEREPKSSTYFLVPASDLICDLFATEMTIHRTRRDGDNAENKPLSKAEAWVWSCGKWHRRNLWRVSGLLFFKMGKLLR